jgi:superfamily II DNA helicase RecQ
MPAEDAPASEGEDGSLELLEELRAWRTRIAKETGMPPYIIAHNALLKAISMRRPNDLDALRMVPGIGPAKLEKFGSDILSIVKTHAAVSGP